MSSLALSPLAQAQAPLDPSNRRFFFREENDKRIFSPFAEDITHFTPLTLKTAKLVAKYVGLNECLFYNVDKRPKSHTPFPKQMSQNLSIAKEIMRLSLLDVPCVILVTQYASNSDALWYTEQAVENACPIAQR